MVVVVVVDMVMVVVVVMVMVGVMVVLRCVYKVRKKQKVSLAWLASVLLQLQLTFFACSSFKVLVDEFAAETASVCRADDHQNYDI